MRHRVAHKNNLIETHQQLEGGLRVITKLYYDYPTQYARLRAKWDPTGEYHRRFEEYLRGLQFNTINNDPVSRKCGFCVLLELVSLAREMRLVQILTALFSLCTVVLLLCGAQPNTATTPPSPPQKTTLAPSFVASASSNNPNVLPTALPAATVCGY